jgi:hypothetical protein
MIQLDLFEKDEALVMLRELKRLKEIDNRVRRGYYANRDKLKEKIMELEKRAVG